LITIVFSVGPWVGQELELDREMSFGRAGCDVTLDEPEVSRRHFVLRPKGADVQVEDLGSSNGTFVNGHRITETVSVQDEDVIRVGTSELVVAVSQEDVPTRLGMPAQRTVAGTPTAAPAPAATAAAGGLPRSAWIAISLVEIALILIAVVLLVYYAVN
jgi:pSer/pThr/pTyr-binding forkhead associated (FHA) protein